METEDPNAFATPGAGAQATMASFAFSGAAPDFSTNPQQGGKDPANVQDANFSTFFGHFIRTFPAKLTEEEADAESAQLPGDIAGFEYLREIALLLQKQRGGRNVVVHLRDVEGWSPESAPVVDAGMRLAHHIRKNYVRILGKLQESLSQAVTEVAQRLSLPDCPVFLQISDDAQYVLSIGDIRCSAIGSLVCIRGQVTRTSDVRPELVKGAFRCLDCGNIEEGVEQVFKYTQPVRCSSPNCNNTVNWELLQERCQYGDFQRVRIQQPSSDEGAQGLPRCIDVIARHGLVENVYAGDVLLVTGAVIAAPDLPALLKPGELPREVSRQLQRRSAETANAANPLRGIGGLGVRELGFKLCMVAVKFETESTGKRASAVEEDRDVYQAADFLSVPAFSWIESIARSPDCLNKLTKAVAPRVWGLESIKKGLLLMLTGGVPKHTGSARLRGDINVCIVGDPSTAKSQLLKWVADFAPRAVFASGKGSTAAGLTAAVVRDADNGDYVLEAGALMYADQGICCIDEFDKMDEKDRSAIHEAMEQQTISVAKAGIQATLNARASVLAACNPRFGRYDRSKPFSANVLIPPPLLSRFDLLFTITDEADVERDTHIFNHVSAYHMHSDDPDATPEEDAQESAVCTADELRLYIHCAQKLKPLLSDAAKRRLVEVYVALRLLDASPGAQHSTRITVRQLESLNRLSEAVARLHFSDTIGVEHVEEAVEIFRASLQRVTSQGEVSLDEGNLVSTSAEASDKTDKTGASAPHACTKISREEYRKITVQILDYVRQNEEHGAVESPAVVEWYIDEVLRCEDTALLDEWVAKLRLIIQRLVDREGLLLGEPSDSGIDGALKLRVHPNVDSSNFSFSGVSTFGYKSFASGAGASSAVDAEAESKFAEPGEEAAPEDDGDLNEEDFDQIQKLLASAQSGNDEDFD